MSSTSQKVKQAFDITMLNTRDTPLQLLNPPSNFQETRYGQCHQKIIYVMILILSASEVTRGRTCVLQMGVRHQRAILVINFDPPKSASFVKVTILQIVIQGGARKTGPPSRRPMQAQVSDSVQEIKQMQMRSTYWSEKVLKMISLYVDALLCTLQHVVIHAMQLSGVNSEN